MRAGWGRRGRPVAADDRIDAVDQAVHRRLVATGPGRVAGESLAQVEQLQFQRPRILSEAQGKPRRLFDDSLDVLDLVQTVVERLERTEGGPLEVARPPGEREHGRSVGGRECGEVQRLDLERRGGDTLCGAVL